MTTYSIQLVYGDVVEQAILCRTLTLALAKLKEHSHFLYLKRINSTGEIFQTHILTLYRYVSGSSMPLGGLILRQDGSLEDKDSLL